MGRRDVKSSHEILIQADCLAENVNYKKVKMIVLPGGRFGTENLRKNDIEKDQCVVFARNKYVAAVCAAPSILAGFGLLEGKRATVHPDFESQMGGAILTNDSRWEHYNRERTCGNNSICTKTSGDATWK